MRKIQWLAAFGCAGLLALSSTARAQPRPYVGYAYPAGGRQGTTFQVRLGGQNLDDLAAVEVSGEGVQARVLEYYRRMSPQDMTLLREQLNDLRRGSKGTAWREGPAKNLIERIERRMTEYCNRPACASISSLAFVEVKIAPNAKPGERELRLVTLRGVSNPLVFHVGQLPEHTRKAMRISEFQVLGKEELALRKRPADEVEAAVAVPCTLNGQIASGEVNRYRFEARKGQRLVISVDARELVPFIADAVPGWFQPVLTLCDSRGKEVAYNDDFRFKPDPTLFFEVPADGQYVLSIVDAIYRGREDFVYRITVGEMPFVTSIFPLGGRAGETAKIEMKGWNLQQAELTPPPPKTGPGIHSVVARRNGVVSNRVPFALDELPEGFDKEPNNDPAHAQKVQMPVILNGRVDRPDDWDVFQVAGKAGDILVAEVQARRLDSPLDSVLRITDASGKLLAMNDDHEDVEFGENTHHADSYLQFKLPADGTYCVHLGDTSRNGGPEYAYRLRLSAPQPDFTLYIVPSSLALRSKNSGNVALHVVRKDGFAGPINLTLKDAPAGFTMYPTSISSAQAVTRITVKTGQVSTPKPIDLSIVGRAKVGQREIVHEAVAAEDRMQAFLWRHLVPAQELAVMVYNPSYQTQPKRVPPAPTTKPATPKPATTKPNDKPKFTKQQVAGRLRQLRNLFEEGLLTDTFYNKKVEECEAAQ